MYRLPETPSQGIMRAMAPKRDPERTRQRLIDAAEKVFYLRGFDRASLEEICSEAGLTRGALNWHFPSKEELLFSVLEHRRFRKAEEARQRNAELASLEGLESVIRSEMETEPLVFDRWAVLGLQSILHSVENPEMRPRSMAMKQATLDGVRQRAALLGDRLVVPLDDAAAMFQAVLDGLLLQEMIFQDNRLQERYQRLLPLLAEALAPGTFPPATETD
jgi:AcrR family transcriptional regulator